MFHRHNNTVIGLRRNVQTIGHAVRRNDQRVIARDGERVGQAIKHPVAAMLNMAQLAVHDFLSPHNLAAKGLANILMAEANAEYRAYLPARL